MKATSGFEDQINKRLNIQEAKEMIQSLGMSTDIYEAASSQVNFSKIAKFIANNSFTGVQEDFGYTDEERMENEQKRQRALEEQRQLQQEEMQMQMQMKEREIELKHLNQQSTDQARSLADTMSKIQIDTQKQTNALQADLAKISAQISQTLAADKERMAVENKFEEPNRALDKPVNINK